MPRKIETEAHVKDIVRQWFDAHGAWHYAPIQNGLGVHGIPDRIGCVPLTVTPEMVGKRIGVLMVVESKRPGRRGEVDHGLSKHQKHNMEEIIRCGGIAAICDGEEDLANIQRLWSEIPNG